MTWRSDAVLERVAERAERGELPSRIEREEIDPAPLSEEEKSGLWLYAWAVHGLRDGHPRRPR